MKLDTCENCGATIGKLETPQVFGESVVCAACWRRLAEASEPVIAASPLTEIAQQIGREALGYDTPGSIRARMTSAKIAAGGHRKCPVCGLAAPAKKRRKGSVVMLIALLCLWVIPGIIYALIYSGYIWTCSACGAKLADAT